MKKISVSVDEETYRLSRIRAAEAGMSISALVRGFLRDLVRGEVSVSRFDRLRRLQDETLDAIRARDAGLRTADDLPRDDLHERDALC